MVGRGMDSLGYVGDDGNVGDISWIEGGSLRIVEGLLKLERLAQVI